MHEDFTALLDRSSYIHLSTGAVFANINYEFPFSLFLSFRELFNDAPKKLGNQLLRFIIYKKIYLVTRSLLNVFCRNISRTHHFHRFIADIFRTSLATDNAASLFMKWVGGRKKRSVKIAAIPLEISLWNRLAQGMYPKVCQFLCCKGMSSASYYWLTLQISIYFSLFIVITDLGGIGVCASQVF